MFKFFTCSSLIINTEAASITHWPPSLIITRESEVVNLTCVARGSPEMEVAILSGNTTLVSERPMSGQSAISTLEVGYTFFGINKSDEGNYSCTLHDELLLNNGSSKQKHFSIIVQGTFAISLLAIQSPDLIIDGDESLIAAVDPIQPSLIPSASLPNHDYMLIYMHVIVHACYSTCMFGIKYS